MTMLRGIVLACSIIYFLFPIMERARVRRAAAPAPPPRRERAAATRRARSRAPCARRPRARASPLGAPVVRVAQQVRGSGAALGREAVAP
jgi:hypothetical protein